MTCRRTPEDRDQVVLRGQHADPTPKDHSHECRGCAPCPVEARRHCTVCTVHLEVTELQTCINCLGLARRHLISIVDLAALLPDHALEAAHDGRLLAADHLLFPGGEALNLMSRGSEGLDDAEVTSADEALPPSYVLAFWEETWREALGLDSHRPPWQRRPAKTLIDAHAFLSEHLGWAAAHHPGFHRFARDLDVCRSHLEDVLHAGDRPAEGVPCFHCGATLIRAYRDPKRCSCGPRPRPGHIAHHRTDVCCLGCATLMRWELRHAGCDQGGRNDTNRVAGWQCPRCKHEYSVGEYDLALRTDFQEVAPALPATELADRLGVEPATIWKWAQRGHVRRHGRASDRRTLYDVADATRHAAKNADAS